MATATYDPILYPTLSQLAPDTFSAYNAQILAGPFSSTGESSLRNLAGAASLEPFEALTVLKAQSGASLSQVDQEILRSASAKNTASPQYSGLSNNVQSFNWFQRYYQEHPVGSHYSGDFNVSRLGGEVLTISTFGTVNASKLNLEQPLKSVQLNVPLSGKAFRDFGESNANLVTAQQFDTDFEAAAKSSYAKIGAQVISGTVLALGAGPVGGTLLSTVSGGASEGATVATSEQAVSGYAGASESFGTVANPFIGATLDVGQIAGPSMLESGLFGAPLEGTLATALSTTTELGVGTSQLFAPAAVSGWAQAGKVGSSLTAGAGVGQLTQTVWQQISTGNFTGLANSLLGVLGVPFQLPGSQPGQPQPSLVYTGGASGGGGASGPFLTVANPAGISVLQYAIGGVLLLGVGWMLLRKG